MRGPFPDLHRAVSIFEIQFAGATTTSRYPKRNFRNSACRKFSIEQFRFSKFSLQVLQLQTLPDIQKGIFEIQLGGKLLRSPFPDLHRAISIFKIQFAGAVMRGPFPDLHTAISSFKIQFAVVTTTSTYPKGIF